MKLPKPLRRAVCAAALALLFLTTNAHAALFTVTKTADTNDGTCDADCSLREAITTANNAAGEDTLRFASNIRGALNLNSTLPVLKSSIRLLGPGASRLQVQRNSASDTPKFRVLRITGNVFFSGITFSNGRITDLQDGNGGAIEISEGAVLTIQNCIFSDNYALKGGAIHNSGGAVFIYNSTFTRNQAVNDGGAILNGVIANAAGTPMLISQCTFYENAAIQNNGGAIFNAGALTLEHSTLHRNSAGAKGSGIFASPESQVAVSHTLISGNYTDGLNGTIGEVDSAPEANAFQSGGFNLIGSGNAINNFTNNDKTKIYDPRVDLLANNGGQTPTLALQVTSPARNAGDPNFSGPPDFDQRGSGFPRVIGNRIDIGAFEAPPVPQISINDVTATEGSAGITDVAFTLTLSTTSARTISVNATPSNGSAIAPDDYTSGGATITFAPSETSKTFRVPVKGDLLNEADETFYVLLSSPVNGTIGKGRGIGTIVNDDAPPSLTIDDARIVEGNSGQKFAVFPLRLSAPSGQGVYVYFSTASNLSARDDDYVPIQGGFTAFNIGSTLAYARILINGDTLDELNEQFTVSISASPQRATITDAVALCTILNDDRAPAISVSDVSISEGNTGTKNLTFTVTLSNPSGQAITVNYATANGTATAPTDYAAQNGTLSFAAGQISKTINVVIHGDAAVEGNETLYVLLSGATNASIGRGRGAGTILNDDSSG